MKILEIIVLSMAALACAVMVTNLVWTLYQDRREKQQEKRREEGPRLTLEGVSKSLGLLWERVYKLEERVARISALFQPGAAIEERGVELPPTRKAAVEGMFNNLHAAPLKPRRLSKRDITRLARAVAHELRQHHQAS
jgi:hypothetical protein